MADASILCPHITSTDLIITQKYHIKHSQTLTNSLVFNYTAMIPEVLSLEELIHLV